MIYDVYDYNFLRLCRYFPKDLQERYESEMLGVNVYKNLQEFKMIKRQSKRLLNTFLVKSNRIFCFLGEIDVTGHLFFIQF